MRKKLREKNQRIKKYPKQKVVNNSLKSTRGIFVNYKMSEVVNTYENPAKKPKLYKIQKPADIFKLNLDCFEEMLEYLSATDLRALSQTCKLLQQLVGAYVKMNYSAATKIDENVFIKDADERIEKSGFNHFIRHVTFCDQPRDHNFTSLDHLNLIRIELNPSIINRIQNLLPNLKILHIKYCPLHCDFYDTFLRFCSKLKRLHITSNDEDIIKSSDNKWLHRTYPSLQHMELYPKQRLRFDVNELIQFFELNRNVRNFSTSYRFLWEHQFEFVESRIQLDFLEVKIFREFGNEPFIMESMFGILNQLYDRGFYKHLHLRLPNITEECTEQMISLQGLEKLSIGAFNQWFSLHRLVHLKEFAITNTPPRVSMVTLAQELVNLEVLFICHGNYGDILPFIQFCPKLRRIIIKEERHSNGRLLKVSVLNEERRKLKNACRLTIFVSDDLFAATKWATGDGRIYFDLVRIQRSDSYRWDYCYQ